MNQNCVLGSAKCVSQTFTVTGVNAIRNYIVLLSVSEYNSSLLYSIVGSMDRESSQQLQMWFSEHFFAPKLAA